MCEMKPKICSEKLTSLAVARNFVGVDSVAEAICGSIVENPLMLGEVDSVQPFDRSLLGSIPQEAKLNFDQKLGHLYEQALALLIDSSEQLDLVAKNLQVFDGAGRTIGELDFVLQDISSGRHIHLELAMKFYLGVCGYDGWTFPGPDPKDNWLRKLDRMRTHQWQLCQRPETKALLHERFGIQAISTEHLILGRIFYPHEVSEAPMPERVLESAGRGRWLRVRDFDQFLGHVTEVYLVDKPLWLVGSASRFSSLADTCSPATVQALKERAAERCFMFHFPESSGPWFLVPDSWPGIS